MCYLKVFNLIYFPSGWRFLYDLSVVNFLYNCVMVKEHTLYGLYSIKFVKAYFMDQIMICLSNDSCTLKMNVNSAVVCWSVQ